MSLKLDGTSIDNMKYCKVAIFVPLESIGVVSCDFDGIYHIQIDDREFVTDEETYWTGVRAHDTLRDQMKKEEE